MIFLSYDMSFSQATFEMIGLPSNKHWVMVAILMGSRAFCTFLIWSTLLYLLFDRNGLKIVVLNADGSKRTVILKYLQRLTMFTVWSWLVQVGFTYFYSTS